MAFYDVNGGIAKPNALATMQQSYAFGFNARQQQEEAKRQNQLRQLAPAIVEGDPTAYAQGAALDPEGAQRFQQAGDAQLRRLKGGMDYLRQAIDSGNPTRIAAAEAQVGPYVARIAGKPWTPGALTADPSAFEAAYARISMLGTPEGREGKVVGNNLVDPVSGQVIYSGPEVPVNAVVVEVADGRGGTHQVMLDPRTRQTFEIPRPGGVPAGAPQPQPARPATSYATATMPDGAADPTIAALPESEQIKAAQFAAQGQDFHVMNGQVIPGQSGGGGAPAAVPTIDRIPLNDVGGGGWGYTPPKPEDAPAGYRWQGEQLVAIPGGPADKPPSETGPKPPAGFRFAADGQSLEVIPGGPADKRGAGAKPLPAEARMKLGMLKAAREALNRYEESVLPSGGGFNETELFKGPAGGYLDEAVNNVLRVESGAAVPADETERGVARYGARIWNTETTARANAEQLRRKIDILERELTGNTAAAPAAPAERTAPAASFAADLSDDDLKKALGL